MSIKKRMDTLRYKMMMEHYPAAKGTTTESIPWVNLVGSRTDMKEHSVSMNF